MDVFDNEDGAIRTAGRSVSFMPMYNPALGEKANERATTTSTLASDLSKVRESLRDMMKGPKSGSLPDAATGP